MKPSARVLRLNILNTQRRDEAALRLAAAISEHSSQQQRLDQLQQYREDYEQQMRSAMASIRSVAELDRRHRFLASIRQAIEQQQSAVDRALRQLDYCQDALLAERRECRRLELLAAKMDADGVVKAGKIEQRQQDEMVMDRYRRKS